MLAVANVYQAGELSAEEREIANAIINAVLPDAELEYRRRLAETALRHHAHDPHWTRWATTDLRQAIDALYGGVASLPLTRTLAENHIQIASAVIATFGAQVVDTFYVKDAFGLKLHQPARREALEKKLRQAIREGAERAGA